jgi:hypothetical protein
VDPRSRGRISPFNGGRDPVADGGLGDDKFGLG